VLYFSLATSLLLLLAAHFAARPAPHPVRGTTFAVCGLALTFGPACAGLFLPTATLLLLIFLTAALTAWPRVRARTRFFVSLSTLAFFGAYAVGGLIALGSMAEYARLRERFPYESMGDRVPALKAAERPARATTDSSEVDAEVEREARRGWMRDRMLKRLHEDTTGLFVNSPGFGVGRMLFAPREQTLESRPRDDPPDQPALRPSDAGPGPASGGIDLDAMHTLGVVDFVHPDGFGYFKDRRHVAGFQPHAFSRIPGPTPLYAVETVELIGLLRHPEPVVYVSTRLPAMAELREAPTRPLDDFEAAGLAAVRAGPDLHTARPGGRRRMVGALRNGRQCVQCHGGDEGDLLGAFSYSLWAAGRTP